MNVIEYIHLYILSKKFFGLIVIKKMYLLPKSSCKIVFHIAEC